MSNLIEKKILSKYFKEVVSGKKTFELRLADWECNEGDVLVLKEIDDTTKVYTGREIRKMVGRVLKTKNVSLFVPEDVERFGYQIISLLPGEAK